MNRNLFSSSVHVVLILLFMYTGSSKLMDMERHVTVMESQPFAGWINEGLAYGLPWLEIIIAVGLVFDKTRVISLYGYIFLMGCFTMYTGLVVLGFFDEVPCSCGGVVSKLGWTGHFILNIIFLLLSVTSLLMERGCKIFMHKQGVS